VSQSVVNCLSEVTMCLLHRVAAALEMGVLEWFDVAEIAIDGFLRSFGWCPEEPCVMTDLMGERGAFM